jgi:hypothetical protein
VAVPQQQSRHTAALTGLNHLLQGGAPLHVSCYAVHWLGHQQQTRCHGECRPAHAPLPSAAAAHAPCYVSRAPHVHQVVVWLRPWVAAGVEVALTRYRGHGAARRLCVAGMHCRQMPLRLCLSCRAGAGRIAATLSAACFYLPIHCQAAVTDSWALTLLRSDSQVLRLRRSSWFTAKAFQTRPTRHPAGSVSKQTNVFSDMHV